MLEYTIGRNSVKIVSKPLSCDKNCDHTLMHYHVENKGNISSVIKTTIIMQKVIYYMRTMTGVRSF
jgi:hypothetical protein